MRKYFSGNYFFSSSKSNVITENWKVFVPEIKWRPKKKGLYRNLGINSAKICGICLCDSCWQALFRLINQLSNFDWEKITLDGGTRSPHNLSTGLGVPAIQRLWNTSPNLRTGLKTHLPIYVSPHLRNQFKYWSGGSSISKHFKHISQFTHLDFLGGLSPLPSPIAKSLLGAKHRWRFLIFQTISLSHKKFVLLSKIPMTSLHLIYGLPPQIKNPGYTYGFKPSLVKIVASKMLHINWHWKRCLNCHRKRDWPKWEMGCRNIFPAIFY